MKTILGRMGKGEAVFRQNRLFLQKALDTTASTNYLGINFMDHGFIDVLDENKKLTGNLEIKRE